LVNLYKDKQYALFLEHFIWGINKLPINLDKIANLVISLIPLLQPVREDFYEKYFQRILQTVSSVSKNRLPDAELVTKLYEVFESMGTDVPIIILGRQCVKVMNIKTGSSELSDAEKLAIAKWWESEQRKEEGQTEKELVAKILVYEELQKLPQRVDPTPEQLLEHLSKFRANKHALLAPDFEAAVHRIYEAFAQSPHRWTSENWKAVEEVARKTEDGASSRKLVKLFLEICRHLRRSHRRHDYLDILASGTVRWMRNSKMFRFLKLLTEFYEDLDKKAKKEYEKKVDTRVKDDGKDEYPGLETWEEEIGREKGLKRFLPF